MPRLGPRLLVFALTVFLLAALCFNRRYHEPLAAIGAPLDASPGHSPAAPADISIGSNIDGSSSSSSSNNNDLTEPNQPDAATGNVVPAASVPAPSPADSRARDRRLARFWRKWSEAMQRARPRSPKISLRGQAPTRKPGEAGEATRRPPPDLVRNPAGELEAMRAAHGLFVKELERNVGADDQAAFGGRGVVMVGGGEYFGPAIVGIHMLRRAGSALPVEVFVPDEDEWERGVCEVYLPRLGARCVVLSRLLQGEDEGAGAGAGGGGEGSARQKRKEAPRFEIRHYQLKSVALLLSSFEEVLLLDSDSIPLVDPDTAVFGAEPFRSRGLVVWPDYWTATESPQFWMVAGLSHFPEGLPATSSEAGQLAVGKRTHLAPLLLATYYNIFGDGYYYPLLSQGALGQGDKETFMAAAVVLNAPYYRVRTPVAALGRHVGNAFKLTAMVQHLPADEVAEKKTTTTTTTGARPAFLHANTPKMNAGHLVDEGDLEDNKHARLRLLGAREEQIKLFGFDVEATVWDLLVETGCALAQVVREWRARERLCEKLREHYKAVFGGGPSNGQSVGRMDPRFGRTGPAV